MHIETLIVPSTTSSLEYIKPQFGYLHSHWRGRRTLDRYVAPLPLPPLHPWGRCLINYCNLVANRKRYCLHFRAWPSGTCRARVKERERESGYLELSSSLKWWEDRERDREREGSVLLLVQEFFARQTKINYAWNHWSVPSWELREP